MFKTETHLHVSEVSRCGKLTAKQMVAAYSAAGYTTVFITDHLVKKFLDSLGDIPWEEKVTIFLSGYYYARVAGEALGLTVLPGAEISLDGCPNHYLAYGITREILLRHPDICYLTPEKLYRVAQEEGFLLIQAHPFRDGRNYPTPEYVHGIEIINTNPRHEDCNGEAERVAGENGLLISAGSDAHREEDVALCGVLTDTPITDVQSFIESVKARKVIPIGGRI